jgi:transformation/transcription domain-associated protein
VYFPDCKQSISLPVEKAIDTALATLKSTSADVYHKRQAWELIRCFLVSVMNLEDDKNTVQHLFTHSSFSEREIPPPTLPGGSKSQLYVNPDAHSRRVHEQALTGIFGKF